MTTWKDLTGYYSVRQPFFLDTVPSEANELVREIRYIRAMHIPDDVYPTREEAVARCRELLEQQRDQALADVEFLSKPYTSPNGITYICDPADERRWMAEVQTSLAIAEGGLDVLR
jgi:hypothetical protein